MKKKIKYIVISVLLLLVTGCSGNYNVKINEDMSVNEELYLTIENKEGLYQKTLKIFNDNNVKEKDYTCISGFCPYCIRYNRICDGSIFRKCLCGRRSAYRKAGRFCRSVR